MKHICYIYIFEYKCLKNIEFILDSHYSYGFEPDNKTLTIKKNKKFSSNFWGNNIYSVAALVGNNGSGKSTAMSFLLDFLVEGSANKSVNGIIVYENKGRLYYYGRNVSATFEGKLLESDNTLIGLNEAFGRTPCFYYSGHFSPYINNDSRNRQSIGGYFASDIMRMLVDFQADAYKGDTMQLYDCLNSHIAQNNYRICMMLANKGLSEIIKYFTLPKYVIIRINKNGETLIKSSIKKENLQREQIRNNIINICYNIAGLYRSSGNNEKALEYYEKANKTTESMSVKNRPDIIGDYDKDIKNRDPNLSKDYQDMIKTYNNKARTCYSNGNYAKALEYYVKVQQISESMLGKDHPDTATTYNNVAVVYDAMGDYSKALEYYEKALQISESKLGKNHPDTATTYNNIGMVYDAMGDYSKALEYYEKALEIRESKLGKTHPITAMTYNNIASAYDGMDNYVNALEYYEKAKKICESKLGEDHPATATIYDNIAGIFGNNGYYDKALEYYEKALKIRESKLGKNHPDTANTYNNIASLYASKGNYDTAVKYYEKAKRIRESKLGTDHPVTAETYNDIAGVNYDMGNYAKALEYYDKAKKIRETKLGKDHPDTVKTYNNIAGVYKAMSNYDKALEYYDKTKKTKETKPEKNYQDTTTTYTNIAKEYKDKSEYEKALQLYEADLRESEEKLNRSYIGITIPPSFTKFFDLSKEDDVENHFWSQMIYHNLLNITCYIWNWKDGFAIIDDWQNHLKNNSVPVLDQFSDYIDSIFDDEKKEILKSLNNILQETKKLSIYKTDSSGTGFLCIDCKENNNSLVNLGERVLNNGLFMTFKLFDFSYAQALESETILSSGEQELLNLFSRIYDATEWLSKWVKKTESSFLVMLDEAEIGFHPDWQRRYLNLVIEFLNKLGAIKKKELDFQIIISTHSPILLSDIPKCCTNYLKVDDGKTINANRDEIGETFAENVFQLYRRSFFMEDGLVGEFARGKIKKLETRIDKGKTKDVLNEIRMIGDDRIREFLMDKYLKKHPENEMLKKEIIRYYEERVAQLKKSKTYKNE